MKIRLHQILIIILIITIVFIILYLFYLIDIPQVIPKGYEIGILFYNFSLSYIAASIFYFIVDYFPKRQRKKQMLTNLEVHTDRIELNINNILENLNYPTGQEVIKIQNVTKENLQNIFRNTSPNYKTKVNYVGLKNAPILKVLDVNNQEINHELEELEKHGDLFSPDLFKSMKDIKRTPIARAFIGGVNMANGINQPISDLSIFTDLFLEYLNKIKTFQDEWENNKN